MTPPSRGGAGETFSAFLKLGLTSFGGPVAHIGYFRREFVERRRWLDEERFAQLLALCQFLPGPASSQLGFALGLLRAGWAGAVAAFVAFTLPSALLLFAFAWLVPSAPAGLGSAALHGLKLVALAVVAHAVVGMARQLCPDAPRAAIAVACAALVLFVPRAWMQLAVIALGMGAGLVVCRSIRPSPGSALDLPHGRAAAWTLLGGFAALLALLPLFAGQDASLAALASGFYRAGALVFGGGHVVLPLLEEVVVATGQVSADEFLAGYGAAQSVPGPLFTLAAYLGAKAATEAPLVGAAIGIAAIFLPGFLLLAGALPLWATLAARPATASAVAGANAAVVGVLAAALYDPVWTSAARGPMDVAIAAVGFLLLLAWRVNALWVVAWCVGAAMTWHAIAAG